MILLASLVFLFQPVVRTLLEQAPKVWSDMEDTISIIRGMVSGFSEMSDEVSAAIAPDGQTESSGSAVEMPTLTDALMLAPAVAGKLAIFAGALFFFLLTRSDIYDWAARRLTEPTGRAETTRKLRDAERAVSQYFVTVTLINVGLGVATAAALQVMGLPGAALWGVLACLMNFIVYIGPAFLVMGLLFSGIAAFDGPMVLAPALSFMALNGLEGQFVTPSLVGRELEVNPLLLFVALVFGIWLWGAIGGIVAIPLLLWVLVLNNALSAPAPPARAAS